MHRKRFRWLACGVAAVALGAPAPASAGHGNSEFAAGNASANMFHLAQRERPGTNSDLAFWKGGAVKGAHHDLLVAGHYNGFRLFDIRNPENPRLVSQVNCRGPQGDVSFYQANNRLLVFVSVDTPQTVEGPPPGAKDCPGGADSVEVLGFEGIRIWDVTNPEFPKFVTAVRTDCGSHTHTTIPDKDDQRGLIYVSSYPLAATGLGPNCPEPTAAGGFLLKPHAKISIVEVPDRAPAGARVLREVPLDDDTDAVSVLPAPGHEDDAPALGAIGCHDITILTEANQSPEANPKPRHELAAAACLTEGQIWDVSNPARPETIDDDGHSHIRNESIEIWHSSTFTWDGRIVIFGDEHGGGLAPGCGSQTDPHGNAWFYRNVEPPAEPPLLARYHIPRQQLAPSGGGQGPFQECSIHNFNVVPINDNRAYIGVSSAYKGGTTVFDFSAVKGAPPHVGPPQTAPVLAQEIGFYDAQVGGEADTWSTYWFNDYIWANDGLGRPTPPRTDDGRGLDVFKILLPNEHGKQLRARNFHHLNPQTQEVSMVQGG